MKLPQSFKSYFWDVDFKTLSFETSRTFILKRILDRGNTDAILWARDHYSDSEIKDILTKSRDLSPKIGSFWANMLGLDKQKVLCLQKPYSPIQFGLSS